MLKRDLAIAEKSFSLNAYNMKVYLGDGSNALQLKNLINDNKIFPPFNNPFNQQLPVQW